MSSTAGVLPDSMQKTLIADDIPAMRMLIKELLLPFGHEILEAEDGVQARDMIFESQPQLVLLDCKMPLLDGIALTKIVRRNADIIQPKIIMISAIGAENRGAALEAGVDDFVTKPLQFDEFRKIIEQYSRH